MLEALILGVIQGVTEFFPISSTAHLVLIPKVFGFSPLMNSLAFDVALHAGTFFALLFCFWRDWFKIIREERRLFFLLVLGSVPAAVAGVMFEDMIASALRSPFVIALMLVLVGAVMLFSERFRGAKTVKGIRLSDALFVGFAQAVALVPGVSRSGVTIAAGLFAGMERAEAARFSFLLSMPIVAGAAFYEGRNITGQAGFEGSLFAAGIAASFLSGLLAIRFLLGFLRRHPVNAFVWYRFALAAAIAGWFAWS